MKKVLLTAILSTFVLTGCNTISGLGTDLSSAGTKLSNAATNVKTKISNIGTDSSSTTTTYSPYAQ